MNSKNNSTGTYGSSGFNKGVDKIDDNLNKTATYGQNTDSQNNQEKVNNKTGTYGLNNKIKREYTENYKTERHGLGLGDEIVLNNLKYNIVEIISESSGEAVIYKVVNNVDKNFALKLYFEFVNYKEEPNTETLNRIKNIIDEDILRLHEFGTGANKYKNKFCFEISDYAEGGDLLSIENIKNKYTYSFLKSNVVPEIFKGIKRLHDNRIYHCDLKPQNIFYLNKEQTDLVIGDYGSAKSYDLGDDREVHITSTVKGTNAYIPTEQGVGTITDKNDYFSFGMILLHLLYPEHFAKDSDNKIFEKKKIEHIRELQNIGLPVIEYNPSFSDLNDLIAGLTLDNKNARWGREEVEKWLKGENVEIKYKNSNEISPIKLGKETIRTSVELINYIDTNEKWFDNLIEDNEGYSSLLLWFTSVRNLEEKKIFDAMIKYYKQDGKNYIKEAIIRYLQPKRQIVIDMKKYDFINLTTSQHYNKIFDSKNDNDLSKTTKSIPIKEYIDKKSSLKQIVSEAISHLDDIWKQNRINDIKFIIFQIEFCFRQLESYYEGDNSLLIRSLLEIMYSIKGIKHPIGENNFQCLLYGKIDDNSLIKLFYAFNTNRKYRDLTNKEYNNIEEICINFAKNQEQFNNSFLILEKNEFFIKSKKENLVKLNLRELLFTVFVKEIKTYIDIIEVRTKNIKNRGFQLKYKYSRSLTEFLANNRIAYQLEDGSNTPDYFYYGNKKLFSTFKSIVSDFLAYLAVENNIPESLVTQNNRLEIQKKIRKAILKSYNITSLLVINILFVSFGYFVGYYSMQSADLKFNPFANDNYFRTNLVCILSSVIFGCIALIFIMKSQKANKIALLYLLFTLFLISANGWIIYGKYTEAKKIFTFRKEYYATNTDFNNLKQNIIITAKDEYSTIKKEIVSGLKSYNYFVNCELKNGYLSILAKAALVKRTFSDVSSISKSTTEFNEINKDDLSNIPITKINFGLSYFIASLNSYKHDNAIPIKVNYRILLDNDDNLSRVGIKINRYVLIMSKDSVEFLVLNSNKELKKEEVNLKPKYFVIAAEPKKGKYTDNYKTKNYNYDYPLGLSYTAFDILQSASAFYDKKEDDFQDVNLILLKEHFYVEINGKRVMSKEFKWDLDKESHAEDLRVYFEPNASFRMDDIKIASLSDLEKDIEKRNKNDFRVTPLIGILSDTTKILQDTNGNIGNEILIPNRTLFEVLYNIGDYYKILLNESNTFGYIKKTQLSELYFKTSNN